MARQASQWQPESNEQDMLRLLHLLRDVACGLKMLKSQHIVHADLVRAIMAWAAVRHCQCDCRADGASGLDGASVFAPTCLA